MNNRFKFRFWDKKDNKFSNKHLLDSSGRLVVGLIDATNFNAYTAFDNDVIVQQFTGLLDKNNKEIYDGDILNFSRIKRNNFYLHDNEFSGCIFFCIDSCQYLIKRLENKNCFLLKLELYLDGFNKTIIGNIFQNPELLKNIS